MHLQNLSFNFENVFSAHFSDLTKIITYNGKTSLGEMMIINNPAMLIIAPLLRKQSYYNPPDILRRYAGFRTATGCYASLLQYTEIAAEAKSSNRIRDAILMASPPKILIFCKDEGEREKKVSFFVILNSSQNDYERQKVDVISELQNRIIYGSTWLSFLYFQIIYVFPSLLFLPTFNLSRSFYLSAKEFLPFNELIKLNFKDVINPAYTTQAHTCFFSTVSV